MRRAVLAATAALVVGLFAVACSTPPASIATAASNPAAVHARAVVLTASDDFAVFQVKARATNLNAGDYYDGELYAVSSTGDRRSLATFSDGPRGLDLV